MQGELDKVNGQIQAKKQEIADSIVGKLVGSANASVDLSNVDYIDLGGMILDGRAGSTGIRFKPGYEPVKYQFAVASTGPWHNTMQTNDKYRRDSLDGGTTWGSAYQFRGQDGSNGSDASVTRANIVRAMLQYTEDDGLYTTTIDGRQCLGINATAIRTGSLKAIEIEGCTITAGSKIATEKDAYIGNELYIGHNGTSWFGGSKRIHLSQGALITCDGIDSPTLSISSATVSIVGGVFDLSGAWDINWGNNAPTAVFA